MQSITEIMFCSWGLGNHSNKRATPVRTLVRHQPFSPLCIQLQLHLTCDVFHQQIFEIIFSFLKHMVGDLSLGVW